MTPELAAALMTWVQATGDLLRIIAVQAGFPFFVAGGAAIAPLAASKGKDWAPQTIARMVLYGGLAFISALVIQALLTR